MSDGQRSRRRFLADLLFLGGALGAGAFLMRADGEASATAQTPDASSPTPATTECTPSVVGDFAPPPPVPPTIKGGPMPPPAVGGKPIASPPPTHLDGEVSLPQQPLTPTPPASSPTVEGRRSPPRPPEQK